MRTYLLVFLVTVLCHASAYAQTARKIEPRLEALISFLNEQKSDHRLPVLVALKEADVDACAEFESRKEVLHCIYKATYADQYEIRRYALELMEMSWAGPVSNFMWLGNFASMNLSPAEIAEVAEIESVERIFWNEISWVDLRTEATAPCAYDKSFGEGRPVQVGRGTRTDEEYEFCVSVGVKASFSNVLREELFLSYDDPAMQLEVFNMRSRVIKPSELLFAYQWLAQPDRKIDFVQNGIGPVWGHSEVMDLVVSRVARGLKILKLEAEGFSTKP